MIDIGSKVTINKNIQDVNGMLYKGAKVHIREEKGEYIQVSDSAGRLFWIKATDISV